MQWPVAVTKEASREGGGYWVGHVINIWRDSTAQFRLPNKLICSVFYYLKCWQNKKGRIFVWDAPKMVCVFYSWQLRKRHNFWHIPNKYLVLLSLSKLYLFSGSWSSNVHLTPLFHSLYILALITSWLQRLSFSHLNIMQLINICFLLIHSTSLQCRLRNCNISTIKELVNKMVIMFAHS